MGLTYAPIEHLCHAPSVRMPFGELSAAIGLSQHDRPYKNHRLLRMFRRLDFLHLAELPRHFATATFPDDFEDHLGIRIAPYLPTLRPNQVADMPVSIQALHAVELASRH